MRSRFAIIIVLSGVVFAAIFALRAAGSLPQIAVSPTDAPRVEAAAAEPVEVQIEEQTPMPATVALAMTQEAERQDGPALLKEHCTQCHTAQMLEQINQPRGDWEKALAKMEGFGVTLDEAEKVVLLDYLAVGEQP